MPVRTPGSASADRTWGSTRPIEPTQPQEADVTDPAPAPRYLDDRIAHWAATKPDAEAMSYLGRTWTWTQWYDRVRRLAGALTRLILVKQRGEAWYEKVFLPRLGPTALLGLLYTIVLMFAMQGDKILAHPLDVVRIAIPLLVYFGIIFLAAFLTAHPFDGFAIGGLAVGDTRAEREEVTHMAAELLPAEPWTTDRTLLCGAIAPTLIDDCESGCGVRGRGRC